MRLYLLKGTNAVNITLDTAGDSAVATKTPAATRLAAIQKVGKAVAGRLP